MTDRLRRRDVLRATGASAGLGVAGCLGGGPDCGDALPTPWQGAEDPGVTVAVFEDFACPHCRTYNVQILPRIVENFIAEGSIRYEHHDYPIPVDREVSPEAANAARAVQDRQGRQAFWTYAKRLYEEQSRLGPDIYASLAAEVGADPQAVREAATGREYSTSVQCDRQRGNDRGVQGTPTVYVNDQQLGSYAYNSIATAIRNAQNFGNV